MAGRKKRTTKKEKEKPNDKQEVMKRTSAADRRKKREISKANDDFFNNLMKQEPIDLGYDAAEAGPAPPARNWNPRLQARHQNLAPYQPPMNASFEQSPEPNGYGSPQPMEDEEAVPAPNHHVVHIKQEPMEEPEDYMPIPMNYQAAMHMKQEPMDEHLENAPLYNVARDGSEGLYIEGEVQNALIAPNLGALEVAVADSTTSPRQEEDPVGQHVRVKMEPLDSPNEEPGPASAQRAQIKMNIKPEPVEPDELFEPQSDYDSERSESPEYDVPGTSNGRVHGSPQLRQPTGTHGPKPKRVQVPFRGVDIKLEERDREETEPLPPGPAPTQRIKTNIKPEPVEADELFEPSDNGEDSDYSERSESPVEYDVPGTSNGRVHGPPQLRQPTGSYRSKSKRVQVPFRGVDIKLEERDEEETELLPPRPRKVQKKYNKMVKMKPDRTLVKVEPPADPNAEVAVTHVTAGLLEMEKIDKTVKKLMAGLTEEEKKMVAKKGDRPRRCIQRINYNEDVLQTHGRTIKIETFIPKQPGNGILKIPKPEPFTPKRSAGRPGRPKNSNPKPVQTPKKNPNGRGRPRKNQIVKEEPMEPEPEEEPEPIAVQEPEFELIDLDPTPPIGPERRDTRESSNDIIIVDPSSPENLAFAQQDEAGNLEQNPEPYKRQQFEIPMEVQEPARADICVPVQQEVEENPRPIMPTEGDIGMDPKDARSHSEGDISLYHHPNRTNLNMFSNYEAVRSGPLHLVAEPIQIERSGPLIAPEPQVERSGPLLAPALFADPQVETSGPLHYRPIVADASAEHSCVHHNIQPAEVTSGPLCMSAEDRRVETSGPLHYIPTVAHHNIESAEVTSGPLCLSTQEPRVETSGPLHYIPNVEDASAERLRNIESAQVTSGPLTTEDPQVETSGPLHYRSTVENDLAERLRNIESAQVTSGPLSAEKLKKVKFNAEFIRLYCQSGGNNGSEMSAASTSKRLGRNTNNSRSSIPTPLHPQVTRRSRVLDSDDDDDDDSSDAEMASTSDTTELAKRPRTPKPRYSPETPRRNTPRAVMSALSVETHRNTDLNADGTGPSSSGSQQPPLSGDSDRREMRRRDDSTRRKQQVHHQEDPRDTPRSHHRKTGHLSCRSHKKKTGGSPEPHLSQDETFMDMEQDSDDGHENLPIITDEPEFKLTSEQKAQFRAIKRHVKEKITIPPHQLADIYKTARSEDVRLPRHIYFGSYIMQSWYGAPFPLEYINTELLYVCEFCLFYARSEPVLQNHTKKCWVRTPPGNEIYRKDNVSIFEVDGRVERDYCQNVCLISRLFLESKTLFYDTDPFLFYIVTLNDAIGAHFAGYFSKEKYEPDKNNLSCIMTLPCFQDKGLGRFLIDVSYALSRKEGWFGGPEQPLSDLGRIAYGSYWRGTIYDYLHEHKMDIEEGDGVSIDCIAVKTGINHHDILEFLDSMGWIGFEEDPDDEDVCLINWNVDWGLIKMHVDEKKRNKRVQFDEKFLDWQPRKITPKMDSFVELTPQEVEEDEQKMKKKQLQQTPISSASLLKSTPASSTSQQNGSIKKTLRSRGSSRSVGRNLKLEISKKVTVPEWADAPDVFSDDEVEKKKRDKRKKKKERRKQRNAANACQDPAIEKSVKREESPDDDTGPSTSAFKAPETTGRSRRRHAADESDASSKQNPSNSGGGQGKRSKKSGGKNMYEGDGSESSSASESSDDDDVPFGAQKGKKGSGKGKKRQRNHKPVSGKTFPPNYGQRKKEEPLKVEDSESVTQKVVEEQKMEVERNKKEDVERRMEREKSEEEMDVDLLLMANNNIIEEELGRDYIIGTPESYHSTPPASPAPMLADEHLPPPQQFGSHPEVLQHHLSVEHQHFEENDAAPPLLVSQVSNLTVSEPIDRGQEVNPILAPNLADGDGYSTGEDEAPPRLSPMYENGEAHEQEEAKEADPQQLMAPTHNGMNAYDPMAPGPSMHMTPQMMTPQNRHPSTSTPQQHPYSHQGPNSHQNTTPGSGGVPSCGPVYNHSTPEQQAAQQQQFMSPMAGMPGSVQSVHSVHNNNSMEMVGGPASLQHTPQQQYEMGGLPMGQMPQDNGVMGNGVATIEQQNQIMMAQHGFNSPPGQNNVLQQQPPQVQPPAPPQVAQMPAAPAPTNGRRRQSDTAAARKRNQQRGHQMAPGQMMMPQQMVPAMNYYNGMNFGYNPYTWDYYNYGIPVYPPVMPDYQRAAAWGVQYPPVQPQAPPQQNGHMPADNGAGGVPAQFPPQAAANQWFYPNNMR